MKLFAFTTVTFVVAVLLTGCADIVPEEKLIGIWEIKGRNTLEGIQIDIQKGNDDKLIGRIIRLNNNKIVSMFSEKGDVWISEIKRSSSFEFKVTEKKIGRELFSLYGMSGSQDFRAQFIDDNTIGLSSDSDPKNSTIIYKRLEQTQQP